MPNALRQLKADLLRALRNVSEDAAPPADPLRAALDDEATVEEVVRHFLTDGRDGHERPRRA